MNANICVSRRVRLSLARAAPVSDRKRVRPPFSVVLSPKETADDEVTSEVMNRCTVPMTVLPKGTYIKAERAMSRYATTEARANDLMVREASKDDWCL